MELETAARRYLLTLPEVTSYVGDKVWKWRRKTLLDGGRAVVVGRIGPSAPPDAVKTSQFIELQVVCWADPTMDDGVPVAADAEDNALALYGVVDKHLHNQRGVRWGAWGSDPGLMIITCTRDSEPEPREDVGEKLIAGRY